MVAASTYAVAHHHALRKAKSLSRHVLQGISDAEKAIVADAEKGRAAEASEREVQAAALKVRADTCMEVVKMCEKCNVQVDDMLRQIGQCLRRLQHARYAQFADLKVCQQRLYLRSDAPSEEMAGDAAQNSLEEQRVCISEARNELLNLEGECRRALEMIGQLRLDLSKEGASQRHSAERCRAVVAILLSVSADPAEDVDIPEPRNAELGQRAEMLLAAAAELATRCGLAVQGTDDRCRRAKQRSELLLERRLMDTEKASKQLREQASEVDFTIAVAERSLARSAKRCAGKENLAKVAKIDATRTALDHLRQTRQALKIHIQNKFKMQTIDASCRKVTSQSASSVETRPATASLASQRSMSAGAGPRRPADDGFEKGRGLPRLSTDSACSLVVPEADAPSAARLNRPKSAATYKVRG